MKTSIELPNRFGVTSSEAAHAHKARVVWLLAYTVSLLLLDLTWLAWLLPDSAGDSTRLTWSRMVLLTSLAGSAGGTLHGLASLSVHVGRRTFDRQWSLFYVARPFLGAGMAVFTWLVLSSGIGGFTITNDLGLLAWSAIAGLYSQPALDKLRDVFATLFKTDSTSGRANGAASNQPVKKDAT